MNITKTQYLEQLNLICLNVACKINDVDYNNVFQKRTPERLRADKFRASYLYYTTDIPFIFSLSHISSQFWQERTTLYNYIDNHWTNLKYDSDYRLLWEQFVVHVQTERNLKGLYVKSYHELHSEFDELAGIYQYSNNISIEESETIVFIEQFIKNNTWRMLRDAKICSNTQYKLYKKNNVYPTHWLSYYVVSSTVIEFICRNDEWIKEFYSLLEILEEDFKNYTGYFTQFKINNWESKDLRELFGGELPYASI
jgi:hypothetical protein